MREGDEPKDLKLSQMQFKKMADPDDDSVEIDCLVYTNLAQTIDQVGVSSLITQTRSWGKMSRAIGENVYTFLNFQKKLLQEMYFY